MKKPEQTSMPKQSVGELWGVDTTQRGNNEKVNRKHFAEYKKKIMEWEKSGIPQNMGTANFQVDDDNWGSADNLIFGSPFHVPFSCANTVDGNCIEMDSIDQCKEYCKNHPECSFGNFIEMNKKKYCLPFYSIYPGLNQFDNIWQARNNYQNINIKTKLFLNLNDFSPWEDIDFNMYYMDPFFLKLEDSDQYLNTIANPNSPSSEGLFLPAKQRLQIMSYLGFPPNGMPVYNYATILINQYGTNLLLQQHIDTELNYQDKVLWSPTFEKGPSTAQDVTLICLEKPPNVPINYNDTVCLSIRGKYIVVDIDSNIVLKTSDEINDAANSQKPFRYKFKFMPNFQVSYCDNELPIEDIVLDEKDKNGVQPQDAPSLHRCNVTTIDKCKKDDDGVFRYEIENKDGTKQNTRAFVGRWCMGLCKDDVNTGFKNVILFTKARKQAIIADQLIISVGITFIAIAIFFILRP